ncbi:alpha-ketoacid dehydrogenase subunit beta [Blastomonas fulva]|uniref:Alpha-ketoacid dehydrogenase subunit beta n=1 Tax=Blastomonas fulva TaxID=1550728 RepID=A0ABN5BAP0_9SPHN|nr:transketolase C-terminal domain-containing protein [Blastomonas fulva]ASR52322.1 alpha-ketoacid dehydrogenase subunit beta [Blastomonas fulva]MDM7929431.1 transketolase C-terminal domain-containing protein [Blastomonas fulva]MDM7965392.1 transketolase C-terminal domain-containing protein [Blastomonas fulva]
MTEMLKMNGIQAINAAMMDAMAADPKVVVLGEDIADPQGGGVTGTMRGLSTKFGGHRVRTTPISEQAIIGAAIGAAMAGYKPVAEIMLMNFTTVAMDMIFNHAAKLRFMSGGQTSVPITIRTLTGAGWQTAGQHSDHLEGWFAHSAGIKVVCPSNPADMKGLLLSCIQDPDPCIFVENGMTLFVPGDVADDQGPIPLGKANVMVEGSDLTIISWSGQVMRCQMALAGLADAGISAELIDLRTISPWDKEAVLASVAKTGRALIVHEAVKAFGPGAEIAATIADEMFGQLKAPVKRLGGPYCPVPFAKVLEDAFIVQPDAILAQAKAMME